MLYEITYIANSVETRQFVQAQSDEEAIQNLIAEHTRYGDPAPTSIVIVGRWAQS